MKFRQSINFTLDSLRCCSRVSSLHVCCRWYWRGARELRSDVVEVIQATSSQVLPLHSMTLSFILSVIFPQKFRIGRQRQGS